MNNLYITIHNALHSNVSSVSFQPKAGHGSISLEVKKYPFSGCKYIEYNGENLVEQNKNKVGSKYANMARDGHRITWIIRESKPWGLIIDNKIEKE